MATKPYSYYSGGTGTYTDPAIRTTHVADAAHADLDVPDTVPVWYAPALPAVADVGSHPGTEWIMTGGTFTLDHTPPGHDGGDTMPAQHTDQAAQYQSGLRHGLDYGGALAGYWAPPPLQFRGEEHQDYVRVAGNGPADDVSVSPVALQRGLNSLPENNPEGYRPGEVAWERPPDRKFAVQLDRTHDMRVLHLNIADGGGTNVPAQGGPYSEAFDTLARAITNVAARPGQRRQPDGISQDIVTDGALDSHYGAPRATVGQWVVV